MDAPRWLTCRLADVPWDDAWLGPHERRVLDGLAFERRRATWRLGRWTAKQALGAMLERSISAFEILAAGDGAPEVWVAGEPAAVSLSLSHRGHCALAVLARQPAAVGCDLEIVEPRSDAFIRDWLSLAEQQLVGAAPRARAPLLANLCWTGKEAAAKVRREGLRLDVRQATVIPDGAVPEAAGWAPLSVRWEDGEQLDGWWCSEADRVMAVLCDPSAPRPERIDL